MWLLVSKDCVGSAGLGQCVWLGKSVFLKKPRPTREIALSYSKVMACICQVRGTGGLLESDGLGL